MSSVNRETDDSRIGRSSSDGETRGKRCCQNRKGDDGCGVPHSKQSNVKRQCLFFCWSIARRSDRSVLDAANECVEGESVGIMRMGMDEATNSVCSGKQRGGSP